MASILKVDKIRVSGGDSDSISFDGTGKVTFHKTVSGGDIAMTKLLDATISSAVAQYDIDSTYINSTYDTYKVVANLIPASDGPDLHSRFFVGGTIDTGTNYGYEGIPMDGGGTFTSDSFDKMRHNRYAIGNASGEAISMEGTLMSINSTTIPASFVGFSHYGYTGTHPTGNPWTCGYKPAQASNVVNGLRLFFSSGDIASGNVQLYGIN